jgi:hypothetical protein
MMIKQNKPTYKQATDLKLLVNKMVTVAMKKPNQIPNSYLNHLLFLYTVF